MKYKELCRCWVGLVNTYHSTLCYYDIASDIHAKQSRTVPTSEMPLVGVRARAAPSPTTPRQPRGKGTEVFVNLLLLGNNKHCCTHSATPVLRVLNRYHLALPPVGQQKSHILTCTITLACMWKFLRPLPPFSFFFFWYFHFIVCSWQMLHALQLRCGTCTGHSVVRGYDLLVRTKHAALKAFLCLFLSDSIL